jgi:galactose mutarotase-like enzyme
MLRICVADAGAELSSVWDKASETERIWTADPAVWNRHAPILFPFVGKVAQGMYRYGGRSYPMKTQPGLARDMDFFCTHASPASVTHMLTASEATRAIYPFDFRLTVCHRLDPEDPRQLHIEWTIENRGGADMLYSIGGHPGFLLPSDWGKHDCFLGFPGKETLDYFSVNPANGLALPSVTHRLSLTDGLTPFADTIYNTWIFGGQGIDAVQIAGPDRAPFVTLRCEEFPLLAVWAKAEAPFICLEPWYGRTDDDGFTGTLAEKPGVEVLAPCGQRRIAYSICFHPQN